MQGVKPNQSATSVPRDDVNKKIGPPLVQSVKPNQVHNFSAKRDVKIKKQRLPSVHRAKPNQHATAVLASL